MSLQPQGLVGLLLVVAAAAYATVRIGKPPTPQQSQAALDAVMAHPLVLAGLALVSAASLAGVAGLGARLSPLRAAQRLRLEKPELPWPVWALHLATFELLSFAAGSLIAASGMRHQGSLEVIDRAMHNARGLQVVALVVTVGLGAGLTEELFYRGYMQTRLVERWGAKVGWVVASVCFGLAHLDPAHTPFAIVIGLYLGWVALRSDSIVPSIAAHATHNSIAVIVTALTKPDAPGSTSTRESVATAVVLGALATVGVVTLRKKLPTEKLDARRRAPVLVDGAAR